MPYVRNFEATVLRERTSSLSVSRFSVLRSAGESIDSFVTTLRLRAKSCDFGDQEESLIRDRVVLGCADHRVQERLLREPDLTLQKALDICRAAEATKGQMQVLQNCESNSSSASVSVDHVRSASRVDVDNASTRNTKSTKKLWQLWTSTPSTSVSGVWQNVSCVQQSQPL